MKLVLSLSTLILATSRTYYVTTFSGGLFVIRNLCITLYNLPIDLLNPFVYNQRYKSKRKDSMKKQYILLIALIALFTALAFKANADRQEAKQVQITEVNRVILRIPKNNFNPPEVQYEEAK